MCPSPGPEGSIHPPDRHVWQHAAAQSLHLQSFQGLERADVAGQTPGLRGQAETTWPTAPLDITSHHCPHLPRSWTSGQDAPRVPWSPSPGSCLGEPFPLGTASAGRILAHAETGTWGWGQSPKGRVSVEPQRGREGSQLSVGQPGGPVGWACGFDLQERIRDIHQPVAA